MVIEGGWLMQYLSAPTANVSTPPVQYGIAPLPIAPTGLRGDLIFTNAWGAYRQTSHPQAAWELSQYMTGEAVQESALRDGFALPTLTALAHDPYFAQHPDDRVLFDALSYGYPDTYGSYDDYIHTRLNDAIDSVFSGQVDARTALDNAAQLINSTVDSTYPDPG
jgi:multiple sugar transport system substrate-binding protein